MTVTVHRSAILWHNPATDRGCEDDYTFFSDDDPDGPTVALSDYEWMRMGSPLVISVTIFAADLREGD